MMEYVEGYYQRGREEVRRGRGGRGGGKEGRALLFL